MRRFFQSRVNITQETTAAKGCVRQAVTWFGQGPWASENQKLNKSAICSTAALQNNNVCNERIRSWTSKPRERNEPCCWQPDVRTCQSYNYQVIQPNKTSGPNCASIGQHLTCTIIVQAMAEQDSRRSTTMQHPYKRCTTVCQLSAQVVNPGEILHHRARLNSFVKLEICIASEPNGDLEKQRFRATVWRNKSTRLRGFGELLIVYLRIKAKLWMQNPRNNRSHDWAAELPSIARTPSNAYWHHRQC